MDRSVDSIGSCSLDVDADSTDFSDTSGSLNLATPSSGKDIPREFTARIKERCQITTQTQINFNSYQPHQQTSAILDPNSGKISTTLVSTSPCIIESPLSSPAKKPSYLNLACCVNGYSNLTTYDSKLRQNINKSREVSPIRPSTNNNLPSSQSNRLSGNFLAVPLTSYGSRSPSSSPSSKGGGGGASTGSDTTMENRHIFSQVHSVDTTDNVVGNDLYFKSSKFISSPNHHLKGSDLHDNDASNTTKSFIQQRVERLYGPGALAQGFYSPKKTRNQEMSILSERSSNSQLKFTSSKTISTYEREITSSSTSTHNGKTTTMSSTSFERTTTNSLGTGDENCENIQNGGGGVCDLPVMRHLRPEFRAQLPIMSPKRSPNKYSLNETSSCPVLQNGTNGGAAYVNGSANGNVTIVTTVNGKSDDKKTRYMGDTESNSPTKYSNGSIVVIHNNNNNSTLESKIISTSSPPTAVVEHIDKKSIDTKTPVEAYNQQNSSKRDCDRLSSSSSSFATEQPSTVSLVTDKMPESEAPADTAVAEASPVGVGGHDVVDKAIVAEPMPVDISVSAATPVADINKYSAENNSSSNDDIVMRDAHYFLRILKTEQTRLLQLADLVEKELDTLLALGTSALSGESLDDVLGYLRSASGKARLLVTQKMKQFEGLCVNNLNQSPDEKFPTTVEDLQGFWDMVMLQVTHVDSLFKEIETLKANNWKKPAQPVPTAPQGSKLTRRPNTTKSISSTSSTTNGSSTINGTSAAAKKTSASSLAAAQRREAQRKQLLEMKRKQKLAMASSSSPDQPDKQQQQNAPKESNQVVEIFVNETQTIS